MKRFLNELKKNLLLVAFIPLLFFVFLSPKDLSQTKTNYYKELFGKEFGFKIYEPDKDKSKKEDYLSSDLKKGYTVILSSSLFSENEIDSLEPSDLKIVATSSEKPLKEYPDESFLTVEASEDIFHSLKKVIFICDKEFSSDYPFKFNCTDEEAFSDEALVLGNILRSKDTENLDWYVIPENLLVSKDGREELENYFKAIGRADEAISKITEDFEESVERISILSRIKDFTDTTVFEFFSLAFSMFLIASLSWKLLRFFSQEKKLSSQSIDAFFSSISNLRVDQKILIVVLVGMFICYFPLVFFISLKDGQGIDLGYVSSYTLETFNLTKINEFSRAGSLFRLGIVAYGFVFLSLSLLLLVPVFISVFKRAGEKISESKVRPSVLKNSYPILIIFSLLGVSFFGVSDIVKVLILLTVLLIFLFIKNIKNGYFEYSSKERFLYIAVSLALIFTGFFFRMKNSTSEIEFKNEDLIGVLDEVVMLPYSKQLGKNVLMNEHLFSGSEPVFVDHYLVYSPVHSKIENKNAVEFKNEGTFYIQNGDLSDIVKALNENKELHDFLISEMPTNFFKIKNPGNSFSDEGKPKFEITFSCQREDLGEDKVRIDFYYVDEKGEIEEDDKTLMYFPGCLEADEPEKYTVDFEYPFTESEYIYVRLVDVLPSDILDVKILKSDVVFEPIYFSKGRGYSIIGSGGLTTSAVVPVTNYIFGDSYDLSFDLNFDEEGKFDLSVPINELIKEGKLKNWFLIWSTQKYLPIRISD